jgi:hypothetical protein
LTRGRSDPKADRTLILSGGASPSGAAFNAHEADNEADKIEEYSR